MWGVWASHCSGFSYCGAWALECWLSSCLRLACSTACGITCSVACGTVLDQATNSCLLRWQGRWILIHFATREVPKYIIRKILSMYSQYPIPNVFCIIQRINEPNLNSVTHRSPEFTFLKGSILNPSYVSCQVQTHLDFFFWRVESTLESTFILLS